MIQLRTTAKLFSLELSNVGTVHLKLHNLGQEQNWDIGTASNFQTALSRTVTFWYDDRRQCQTWQNCKLPSAFNRGKSFVKIVIGAYMHYSTATEISDFHWSRFFSGIKCNWKVSWLSLSNRMSLKVSRPSSVKIEPRQNALLIRFGTFFSLIIFHLGLNWLGIDSATFK